MTWLSDEADYVDAYNHLQREHGVSLTKDEASRMSRNDLVQLHDALDEEDDR